MARGTFADLIAIVILIMTAYAFAAPVQDGLNLPQRNEYGSPPSPNLLAKYFEDRGMQYGCSKRNLDKIGGGNLLRDTYQQQLRHLSDGAANSRHMQNFLRDRQIASQDAINRPDFVLTADQFQREHFIFPFGTETLVEPMDYYPSFRAMRIDKGNFPNNPIRYELNSDRMHVQSFMDQLINNAPRNINGEQRRIMKNLDHVDNEHLTKTFPDETNDRYLLRNLDQIGGGHLLRNLNALNDENPLNVSCNSNESKMKRYFNQPANIPNELRNTNFIRNLDQIGGGNLLRNLDPIGGGNLLKRSSPSMEPRNLDNGLGNGRPSFRQTSRGLDSLSGATFGESKRFAPIRRGNFDEIDRSGFDHFVKRNFDEIDRTAFDSFFKRNFDEIDRVGWNGFVKKLDNYLANKERR